MNTLSATLTPPAVRPRWYSFSRFTAGLSLLGVAACCYVGGAAAMYFGLPSSECLALAFEGGRDGTDPNATLRGDPGRAVLTSSQPANTFAGYTLYTTTHAAAATLLDMEGNAVHRWRLPRSSAWSGAGTAASPSGGSRH